MKKLIFYSILLLFGQNLFAQAISNNSWIKYDQPYYKFLVYELSDGLGGNMFRINYADLQRFGFNFGSDPRNIQVFWRGKEIAVRVVGEEDGRFDPNDYVEFFGKRNDVGFETEMYDSPSSISQRTMSLHNPLAAYFLTVGKERGKRFTQIVYTNNNDPLVTNFVNRNLFSERTTATSDGAVYPEGIRENLYGRGSLLSNFAAGKGFYISRNPVGTYSYPFTLTGLTDSVPQFRLEMRFMGWLNTTSHIIDLYAESSDTPRKLIKTYTFRNYEILEINELLTDFRFKRGQNFTFTFQVRQGNVNLTYYRIIYPQTANANFTNRFRLPTNATNRTRLQVANTASNAELFDITDEYNVRLVQTIRAGAGFEALIPDTRQERSFFINTGAQNATSGYSRSMPSPMTPLDTDAEFIIISHPDLMKPAGGYTDPVKAYADYKASPAGGGFKTTVVDINQIYDQFGYGDYGALPIRKYMEHIWRSGGKPKHLFFIGRAISTRFFYFFGLLSPSDPIRSLVPTWGIPSSDSEITENLNGAMRHVAGISTGRLPAMTPAEVANYLDKVKEYDQALVTNPAWRKNILHLSGGFDPGQVRSFRAIVDGLKNIAEKNLLAGKVSTISKSNSDYVETINVQQELNEGLLLLTLFGHSDSQWSDINIGKASDPVFAYNNKGKYPMIIANGCGSGDIFHNRVFANAEDWILSKDKGCVLYWAHNHNGFDKTMATYMETFYQTAFADRNFIAQPIGEIVLETNRRFLRNNNDQTSIANAQQFTLQGDPSLLLFGKKLPDYQITNNSLFVKSLSPRNPNRPTAQDDAFQMGIAISNLGIYQADSIVVSIRRSLTDGTEETYQQKFKAIANQDTVYFTIINTNRMKQLGSGANRFEVKVDSENKVTELREDNNMAVLEYFFPKSQVITVAPRDYSIENQETAYLVAQNTNANSPERLYRFEIDTSFNFNSRLKKDTTIYAYTSPQWTTKLALAVDSTVYYWRVRPAQFQSDDDTTWANASFVYIKQSPGGWSQSHFHQFRQSSNAGIGQEERSRKWIFRTPETKIKAKIVGAGRADWADFVLNVNGIDMIKGGQCNPQSLTANFNAVFFLVIDGETGRPYNSSQLNPEANCGASGLITFYRQDFAAEWFNRFVYPNIKNGDYVIIMNSRNTNWDLFFNNARTNLAALGIDVTNRKIGSSGAYIAVGRKGAAANTAFEVGIPVTELRDVEYTINHTLRSGSITSTPIGPALRWNNVFRRIDTRDSQTETWRLDIVGINPNGIENTIFTDVKPDAFDISSIDVGAYPYLRLRATLRDAEKLTPMQLKRWQVVFQEVPEGVLLYDSLTYRENNTLRIVEGDSVKIGFYFRNVSNTDFPRPIVVHYNIIGESGGGRNYYDTLPPVKRGENRYFVAKIPSTDWIGTNRLQVFVNPRFQPEQIYENNTIEARFAVSRDNIRPILDVAFDGKHLLDGEIVQPTPTIAIQLKDNNKVLKIIDPSTLEVSLRKCPTCAFEKVNIWDKTIVNWQVTPEKQLILEYKPQKLDNGTYTLRVQAADRRGNLAGLEPYQINFQVINESMVSNFYPYPNPFSSKAKFVFTLTGKVPDKLRIRIMTITGKTVKTINKEELGNLRVGNNVTDYAWDGTDEFGDKLANGVYIYKVDIQDDTEEVKHFDTAGDQFFKKGYGKIYLMR